MKKLLITLATLSLFFGCITSPEKEVNTLTITETDTLVLVEVRVDTVPPDIFLTRYTEVYSLSTITFEDGMYVFPRPPFQGRWDFAGGQFMLDSVRVKRPFESITNDTIVNNTYDDWSDRWVKISWARKWGK